MNRFRATLGLVGSVGVFLLRRYRPRKCMKILLHIGGLAVGAPVSVGKVLVYTGRR